MFSLGQLQGYIDPTLTPIHICHQILCTNTNEVSISKWIINELTVTAQQEQCFTPRRQRHKQGVLAESIY